MSVHDDYIEVWIRNWNVFRCCYR